jgi:hypothetical protein
VAMEMRVAACIVAAGEARKEVLEQDNAWEQEQGAKGRKLGHVGRSQALSCSKFVCFAATRVARPCACPPPQCPQPAKRKPRCRPSSKPRGARRRKPSPSGRHDHAAASPHPSAQPPSRNAFR